MQVLRRNGYYCSSKYLQAMVFPLMLSLWVATGCQSSFDHLYHRAVIQGDRSVDKAQFRSYYAELAERLTVDTYYPISEIFAAHGHPYAAAHLGPLLGSAMGERRIIMAGFLTLFSHGNDVEAAEIIRHAQAGDKAVLGKLVESFRLELDYMEKAAGCFEVPDALAYNVPPDVWHAMDKKNRWRTMQTHWRIAEEWKNIGPGRVDYEQVVDRLGKDNWWAVTRHIVIKEGNWNAAIRLEESLAGAKGEKRVVLAMIVGILSMGNCPASYRVLSDSDPGSGDEKLIALAQRIKGMLPFLRESYDSSLRSEETFFGLSQPAWRASSLEKRWSLIAAAQRTAE